MSSALGNNYEPFRQINCCPRSQSITVLIFAVNGYDVFPADPAGVYAKFWGNVPGQLVPQRSPTVVYSEGCVVLPLLADVWRTVLGKHRRCFEYFDNSLITI